MSGLLASAVIIAGSALIVMIAADRPSVISATTRANYFPGWMAGPLGGLWPVLTHGESELKALFSIAMLVMYASYLLGMRSIAGLGARFAIGAIVVVQVIFFLAPPLTLTDVFNYINYGRMDIVHHLNPYATIPALEPHRDPAYALSNWHDLLSPYGPLFTIFTFALVPLGVVASFWVVKGALGLLSFAILALVWRCAKLLEHDPVHAIVLVGLNPIVLVWGLGGDHNDYVMMFFIMLAVWLLLRSAPRVSADRALARARSWLLPLAGNEIAAGAALAAAVFVKASAAIVIPVMLAALARTSRRAVQTVIGGVIGGVAFGAISYLVFGVHLPSLGTQGTIVTDLSIPNLLGLALGLGGENELLRAVVALALVIAIGACCFAAWRRSDLIGPSAWATIALLITLGWVLPWYIVWALPLVALSRSRRLRFAAAALGLYLVLAWTPSTSSVTRTLGFHPDKTTLGQQHQRTVQELMQ